MRLGNPKVKMIMTGVIVAGFITGVGLSYAQEAGKAERKSTRSFQLKEAEITGKLRDVLGSLKLSETEIVGMVERPRLSYSLPWREPELLLLESGEGRSGFLKEIYTPLDKETFSREIRSEGGRLSGKESE